MAGSLKILIVLTALAGIAGCAYQDPLQLPDPYRTDGWGSSRNSYSFYGGYGGYSPYYFGGYSPFYGYGMTDPFYYRYGYPIYGYYRYPQYPVHYCADVNRDGRCDRKPRDRDDDSVHDGGHDGRGDGPRVAEPGRDRDGDGRLTPRDLPREQERLAPTGRAIERQLPRANSSSSTGAAGMTPRAPPPSKRQAPAGPKEAPAASRSSPRADDSASPSPGLRPADR
jgi:predicted small lipoprotein YifL